MSLIPPEPEAESELGLDAESAFMSMDLDASLGVISDATACPCCPPANDNSSATPRCYAQPSKISFQGVPISSPAFLMSFGAGPILMENPNVNQKVTRTSLTYPFADKKKSSEEEDDEDEDNIDGIDGSEGISSPPMSSFFEPIHLSDEATDLSMMMFLQDDEAQDALVDRIGGGKGRNIVPDSTSARDPPPSPSRKRSRDCQDDAIAWEGLNLIEAEVEEEDDLFYLLEEEEVQMAKEGGFVLENIGDRQSFWNEER